MAAVRPRAAWLLTLAVGVIVVTVGRIGPDWPAQEFRAAIGLRPWNDAWYAGHALIGYSVLFPPIGRAIGVGTVGVVAATITVWSAVRLLPEQMTADPRLRAAVEVAFALPVVGSLVTGQVPFLLGLAFGGPALLAVRGRRPWLAAGLAVAASLASPLPGFFVLVLGLTWLPDIGWRRALPLSGAGTGSVVALIFGGGGGTFPFDATFWGPLLGFTLGGLLIVPRTWPLVRRFIWLIAAASVVLFVVPNPLGGNVDRLPQLLALPMGLVALAAAVRGRRGLLGHGRLLVAAVGLLASLAWFLAPVTLAVARSAGDPSSSAGFYRGMLAYLSANTSVGDRVEIPFTRGHWEAAYVAPHVPIARGWERQTDLKYDAVLYHPLTAASYRQWLDAQAVDLVALPRAPLDPGGAAEKALLAHPPPYLREVYADAGWTVWRVLDPAPLVTGAHLVRLGTSSVTLRFDAPGDATVKVHSSPLWESRTSTTCVIHDGSPWLRVHATRAGTYVVDAAIAPALEPGTSSCS